jgi:hypothetical protein
LTFSTFQVSGQFGPQEPEEPAVVAPEDVTGGRKVFRQHHHAAHGPGGKQGGGHEGHAQVSLTIFLFGFDKLRPGFLFYLFSLFLFSLSIEDNPFEF